MSEKRTNQREPWEIDRLSAPDGGVHIAVRLVTSIPGSGLSSHVAKYVLGHATCTGCGQPVVALESHIACKTGTSRRYVAKFHLSREDADYLAKIWLADRQRANKERRQHRLMMAGGSHTREEISRVYQIQEGRCFYCYSELMASGDPAQVHRDHFIPVMRGGGDGIDNIVLACSWCNQDKAGVIGPNYFDRRIDALPWPIRRRLRKLRQLRISDTTTPLDPRE